MDNQSDLIFVFSPLLVSDISLPVSPFPSPVLVTLHPSTEKVVVASCCHVGARNVHKGCVLLKTILQAPAKEKDGKVVVEVPTEQVK